MKKARLKIGLTIIFLFALVVNWNHSPDRQAWGATPPCTHYASPTGGGTGASQGSPFQISNFLSIAASGMILCLLPGTYTGANSMITPSSGRSGVAGNPITIRAFSESPVTNIPMITGRDDGGLVGRGVGLFNDRIAFRLSSNDWWVIEGIDICCTSHDSVAGFDSGADNNIIRRVVAWDPDANRDAGPFGNTSNTGNLLEDVAAFGEGRKVFSTSQNGDNFTVRRAWGMWNKWSPAGQASGSKGKYDGDNPKEVFGTIYNSYNTTYENVIGTWNGLEEPGACCPYSILQMGDGFSSGNTCANTKFLGAIAYFRPGLTFGPVRGGSYGSHSVDCVEYRDVFISTVGTSIPPMLADSYGGANDFHTDCAGNARGKCDRQINNLTTVGLTANSISVPPNGWTVTQHSNGANLSSVPSPWRTTSGPTSAGASVCFQYQNRTLTKIPLWPWPMDARINQALTRSGRSPTAILGSTGTITGQIEALFGTIPSSCLTGAVTPPPTPNLVLAISCDNTVADVSSRNNNGSLQGGATYAPGKYNEACSLNGTSGHILVPDSDSLDLTTFSLGGWFKPSSPMTATYTSLITKNSDVYYLYASSPAPCPIGVVGGYLSAGNYFEACYGTALTAGVWTRLDVTFDGTTILIYKDGVPVTSAVGGALPSASTGSLMIGATNMGFYFPGLVDDIRIYDQAIPQAAGANQCINAPSILRDINCPINPVVPISAPGGFTIGASGSLTIGAGGSVKHGN